MYASSIYITIIISVRISIIANNRSVDASIYRITCFSSTNRAIITQARRFVMHTSLIRITMVVGTNVFIIAIYGSVYTTASRTAAINGTFVAIIAINRIIDTSVNRTAAIIGTFTVIITN
jgi:hypothetical protein